MSEFCRAVPCGSSCAPLICFTGIHGTEQRCGQRDGRSRVHPPFDAAGAALRASPPAQGHKAELAAAAPRGCSLGWGISALCSETSEHGGIEGQGCSASTRGFEYLFCSFPKSVLTQKLFQQLQKSTVFSSQSNLSFCVTSCTIPGG